MTKGEVQLKAYALRKDIDELLKTFVTDTQYAPSIAISVKKVTWFKKDGKLCYDVAFTVTGTNRKLDPNKKWWQFWKV